MKDAVGATSSTTLTFTVNGANDAPVAANDTATTTQGSTLSVTAANGVILSGSAPSGKDTDPDGDALVISAIRTGTEAAGTGTAGTIGSVLHGSLGDLILNSNGSYTYTPDSSIALPAGFTGVDAFTYTVSDGHGGTAQAELDVTVNINTTLTSSNVTLASSALGLHGEYYGYNDSGKGSGYRTHSDDDTVGANVLYASSSGYAKGNLERLSDITTIINERNGSAVVGTGQDASNTADDAVFVAKHLSYGDTPTVTNGLGTNPNFAAGATITSGNLYNFLGATQSDSDVAGLHATTGVGQTTDAIVRMDGEVYMQGGDYTFKVTGDDGFRLYIDGVNVLQFDNITSATSVTANVTVSEGFHSMEVLYWDQVHQLGFRRTGQTGGTTR